MADTNESNVMEGDSESTAGDGDLHRKANRVIAFLSQIVECLEETEMVDMNEILLGVFEVSKQKDSAETKESLMQLYSSFFEIVEFHSGISVTLIDQALRSFKMIAMDAEGLGKLVSEKYMEMILMEYPSLSIDMKLTTELLRTYFRLLKEGFEEICHIRLMVVGMYGVGKSTLVKRLCNQSIDNIESTEGIDILTDSCEINDDGEWEISNKNEKDRFFQERLQVLVNKYGKIKKPGPRESIALPTEESVTVTEPLPSQHEPYIEEEEKLFAKQVVERRRENTDTGIVPDLIKADKENKILKRKPTVSIWDFAGQSVYYSTHHIFLNARSIYLVVLNLSKKLKDKVDEKDCMGLHKNLIIGQTNEYLTCHDAFKFWMRSIYIYTEQKEKEQGSSYKPAIILIGTHKDMITDDMLGGKSLEQYKEDYFNDALICFEGRPVLKLVHNKKFLIERYGKDEDFLEIKKEILEVAKNSTFWKEKVPASFILLEKAVQEQKDLKTVHVMEFEDLEKANKNSDLPRPERKDIELFLTFQNAFGNVLYYNHDQLCRMIILSPQWIINIFKIFVTHKKNKVPEDLYKWKDFESYGKLEVDLMNKLLERNSLFGPKEVVLCYMEYLDVMVQPVKAISNQDCAVGCQSQTKNATLFFPQYCTNKQTMTEFYILPCMLPPRPSDEKLKDLFTDSDIKQPPTLCMYIKKGFLPPFVVHCIIATCIKELPISQRTDKLLLFSHLSEFELDDTTRLLIWFVDDFLHFTVVFKDPTQTYKQKVECCKYVKKCFEKLVLRVFNIHGKDTFDDSNKGSLFEYLVKCPKCRKQVPFQKASESKPYIHEFIGVTHIKSSMKKTCCICGKVVKIEEALGFWFDIEPYQSEDMTGITNVEDHPPTEDMLADFADYVGLSIGGLRCELNIDDIDYERICIDYGDFHVTKVFHVLYHWMMGNESLRELYKAMKMSECRITDEVFNTIVSRKLSEETEKTVNSHMKGLDVKKFEDGNQWDIVVNELAKCIAGEHWVLGIRLGIPEIDMQHIKGECVKSRIRHILNSWRRDGNSLKDLITAMVKSKCHMKKVKAALMQFYSSST